MNADVLKLFLLQMPFKANDIYLEDKTKLVRAVCSNNVVAQFLADCTNAFNYVLVDDIKNNEKYKKFICLAACLRTAIIKAHLPINTQNDYFLAKAFELFSKELDDIINIDSSVLKTKIEQTDSKLLQSSNLSSDINGKK